MTPGIKVKLLETGAIVLIAAGLTMFEQSVRKRVKLENSSEAWINAAEVKEPITDASGPG